MRYSFFVSFLILPAYILCCGHSICQNELSITLPKESLFLEEMDKHKTKEGIWNPTESVESDHSRALSVNPFVNEELSSTEEEKIEDCNVASFKKESAYGFQSNAFYINKAMGEYSWGVSNRPYDHSFEVLDGENYGQFYLSHTFGRGLGDQKGYTTLGAFFIPPLFFNHNTSLFIDGSGHYFDDGKWAGSVGLGSRYLINCNTVLGFNAYYDYRRFHKFDLNQLGIGFELLGNCVDLRLNGYIPIGKKSFCRSHFYDYSGGYLAIFENQAFACYGVDAEIGKWLRKPSCCNCFSLYFAAGPYYYWRDQSYDQHENHLKYHSESRHEHRHAFGGRASLEAAFSEVFKFSVEATYDSVWHARVQGQIAVVIPLIDCQSLWNMIQSPVNGCLACRSSNPILSQSVKRNRQIVASQRDKCSWNWSADSSCSSGFTSYSTCSCYSD